MLNELIEKWREEAKIYRKDAVWQDSETFNYLYAKSEVYDECADELEKLGNSEGGC